jgi:uroporphyrinogen decarboxylase
MIQNAYEDMKAALERRIPAGAVPIWELEFHAWDAASGRHVVLGEEMERLTPAEQERAMQENAEIIVSVCRDLHFAAVTPPGPYWHTAPGELAYNVLPGDLRWRQFEILRALAGDELALVGGAGGIIAANYSPEFCEALFFEPEKVDQMAEQGLALGLENARRYRDLGAEIIFTASDIADNSGPFFNPDQMARFILPYVRRWAEAAHEMGLLTIMHSDGQLTPYLDALADTGMDALQAIDSVAGMDMARTRQVVGNRLCLCGNVDCGLLLLGTPEKVYEATTTLLQKQKPHGAFVLGASNAVQKDVPMQNYRAMIEAWKSAGQYEGFQQ